MAFLFHRFRQSGSAHNPSQASVEPSSRTGWYKTAATCRFHPRKSQNEQRNSCACGAPFSQADVSEAEWKGDRGWRRRAIRGSKLFDSSLRACEAGLGVPEDPANHASIVVDVADDVVQRRETVE